jgi:hypothetical protein
MRRFLGTVVVAVLCSLLAVPVMADARATNRGATRGETRTLVFRLRISGLVAEGVWTTCPAPADGDVCTDTIVFAFDTKDGRTRSARARRCCES